MDCDLCRACKEHTGFSYINEGLTFKQLSPKAKLKAIADFADSDLDTESVIALMDDDCPDFDRDGNYEENYLVSDCCGEPPYA